MQVINKMPLDAMLVREKIASKEAEIERLQGLIDRNEEKAENYERTRAAYRAVVNQYQEDIRGLQFDILRLKTMIGEGK